MQTIDAYMEQNGLLVVEAENATATAAGSHDWVTQTAQTGYEGTGYIRALPDVGARFEETETASSPQLSWPIYNETAGTYAVWVRGMAPDAGGDSLHVGLNGGAPGSAADLTGFTNEWGWRRVTMAGGNATLDLTETGAHTLDAWMREDGLRVDRMLLVTDTTYIPSGLGPAESVFQTITETMPGGLGTMSIAYQYDALHRLTGATYSGAITATFEYVYDAVGNMTAYTETVDGQTTSVSRAFDAANRLQTSLDATAGTTSYIYDDNGNLTEVYPPGSDGQNPVGVLRYDYDQRNLMVSHEANLDGTAWVLRATYVYDGANDRLQQVNYTSGTPVTTTYSNDVVGLTQVLVADDGTRQVVNLFGLDLVSQDSGAEVRTLLVDGLGSVRVEMVGGTVESATTYEPYGEVLEQRGTSGTVYGFSGEQEDSATGLLYLRARYYSPKLKVFQSRDPWEGSGWRPGTLNYYVYVHNNPVRLVDSSGLCGRDPNNYYHDYKCWKLVSEANRLRLGSYDYLASLSTYQLRIILNSHYSIEQVPTYPNVGQNLWTGINAVGSLNTGRNLFQGGFRIWQVPEAMARYAGETRVFGTHSASISAGLNPYLRHAKSANLGPYANWGSLRAASNELASVGSKGTVMFTVAANVCDYTIGENAEYGLASSEFLAANTVDIGTGVGLPVAGAALLGQFGPQYAPFGAAVGGFADIGLRIFWPEGRVRAIAITNEQLESTFEPIRLLGTEMRAITNNSPGSGPPLWEIPSYADPYSLPSGLDSYSIDVTYPINGTVRTVLPNSP